MSGDRSKMATDEVSIRRAVRDHYSELAQTGKGSGGCCGPAPGQTDATPSEASQVYDGCGSPIEAAAIKEGEVIVDLGSGGGLDVFRASKLVGESGYVIGVDATPEMVWRARETAKKHAYSNVEFRLGEIEHLPMDSSSADVIVSNCVINLAPDKGAVFREAYRALRPGGRLVISDTVAECTLKIDPKDLNAREQCVASKDVDSWAECVAGALPEDEYVDLIKGTGFIDLDVKGKTQSGGSQGIASITITATKPEKPQANTR